MISKEEVQHIAKLARLELSGKEIEKMQKDMSVILDYFAILKKAKTVKSTSSIFFKNIGIEKVTRKDKAISQTASLANNLVAMAPDKKDGYIKVRSIL
jgi:aspartyl-tRNA(Asn)/glutamyl-tRNA(Gln) amidotransferase subunit C